MLRRYGIAGFSKHCSCDPVSTEADTRGGTNMAPACSSWKEVEGKGCTYYTCDLGVRGHCSREGLENLTFDREGQVCV